MSAEATAKVLGLADDTQAEYRAAHRNDLTANDARASVSRAKTAGIAFAEEIVRQVEGRAWIALGYVSWDDMRTEEYGEFAVMLPRAPRQELVANLRKAGLTQQQIADTAGVSEATIRNDLNRNSAVEVPAVITTARGERPATYTTQTPAPVEEGEAETGAGLPTPAAIAPSPQIAAGPYSSDADAVGAPASGVQTPAAEHGQERCPRGPVRSAAGGPTWSPVDDTTADLLTLVAEQHPATPQEAREWDHFLGVLREVTKATGYIDQNAVRPLLRGEVKPQRIGAFYNRAAKTGLIRPSAEHATSNDKHGRNSGKPMRVWEWLGAAS